MRQALGGFEVTAWQENSYDEGPGLPKMTWVHATMRFTGDVDGNAILAFLMMYRDDGTASYAGLHRITGRVHDKSGSFVIQETGVFDGRVSRGKWTLVPGSGTGELKNLNGSGSASATSKTDSSYTLDYDL